MAVIHRAEIRPTKLELLGEWLPKLPWYPGEPGAAPASVGAYRFDDPRGEVGIETLLVRTVGGQVAQVPLTYRGAPLPGGEPSLVGTMEHSVLGRRWVYDGCGDPVLPVLPGRRGSRAVGAGGGTRRGHEHRRPAVVCTPTVWVCGDGYAECDGPRRRVGGGPAVGGGVAGATPPRAGARSCEPRGSSSPSCGRWTCGLGTPRQTWTGPAPMRTRAVRCSAHGPTRRGRCGWRRFGESDAGRRSDPGRVSGGVRPERRAVTDQPAMPERVEEAALPVLAPRHLVVAYGIVVVRPCGDRAGDEAVRVVHESLHPHGRRACLGGRRPAVLLRLTEEELCAPDLQPDDRAEVPQLAGAERPRRTTARRWERRERPA